MQLGNLVLSHILCAVDFSISAHAAFQQALSLARAHNAQLSLVFAVPLDVRFNWRARERTALLREFRRLAAAVGVSINVSVQQGDPAEMTLLHAASRKYDAIVMGTHDPAGLKRFRMDSVAERVIAHAECPTLLVRSTVAPLEKSRFTHILCPVIIAPPSKNALESALGILKHGGDRLTVLHVGSPTRERDARIRLQQLVAVPADLRGKIHARLSDGPVATRILSVAAELQPDLIVLGKTSPRWTRNSFNSITNRIVSSSPCSVLTIPGEGRLDRAA